MDGKHWWFWFVAISLGLITLEAAYIAAALVIIALARKP